MIKKIQVSVRHAVFAAAAAFTLPMSAHAASVVYDVDNTVFLIYDTVGENVDLGNRNIATDPLSVQASFARNFANPGNGSLEFSVFADPYRSKATGSIDVNIVGVALNDVSATFGGAAVSFSLENGDLTATLDTKFADVSDLKSFILNFTGASQGDQIQVNLMGTSPVPVPAAVMLLGSGVLAFGVIRRRKKS